ncbi:preprotein translocase subunit SecE [uncultured Deefgea sp.]|uniref:preprotein translocase subunit SecE n=1 Tax=uncultured Deefgea sp. TaxID=1304914 RepID=UPI0026097578|nr:preprotein translocase subunit SecE [uncultured Deefgea sp.]
MQSIERLKVVAALALVLLGVAGFYMVPAGQSFLGSLCVAVGVVAAGAVMWFTTLGRTFVDYARDSVKEAQKVVWPSKKETWQVTAVVFLFVGVLALFMWAVDSGLAWLFYDVVLGRGQ